MAHGVHCHLKGAPLVDASVHQTSSSPALCATTVTTSVDTHLQPTWQEVKQSCNTWWLLWLQLVDIGVVAAAEGLEQTVYLAISLSTSPAEGPLVQLLPNTPAARCVLLVTMQKHNAGTQCTHSPFLPSSLPLIHSSLHCFPPSTSSLPFSLSLSPLSSLLSLLSLLSPLSSPLLSLLTPVIRLWQLFI